MCALFYLVANIVQGTVMVEANAYFFDKIAKSRLYLADSAADKLQQQITYQCDKYL
jgi:hypothetical protein